MATRDYTKATAYESSPAQVKNREARNKARAMEERKLGRKLPTDVDVDHKLPMKNGGKTTPSNIRAISESRNEAWRKGSKGYKVRSV